MTTVRRIPGRCEPAPPPPPPEPLRCPVPRLWTVAAGGRVGPQNRGMLRLAASSPPLWRTPSSLQLGTDPAIRVDGVLPWQERLLDALADGVADAGLVPLARSFGATAAEAAEFAGRIEHALTRESPTPRAVRVEVPESLTSIEREALMAGWDAAGLARVSVDTWAVDAPQQGVPVIVVADRLIEPRRAARLMRADVTHIPIELAGDRVHVGPVVVPGVTACTACEHARRTAEDPQWPLLAAQLLGRDPVRTDPGLLIEAGILTGRLLRDALDSSGSRPDEPQSSLSVGLSAARVRRTWHAHRPHARCLCRSPEGSGNADAGAIPTVPTSSSKGYAQPA